MVDMNIGKIIPANKLTLDDTKDKRINVLKTYIIQFIYPNGNGWAFVNAQTVSQAESIFYRQTKFQNTKITGIKETKWYGENIQLVFEGSVTTSQILNVTVSLTDLINSSDSFNSVEEYLNSIFDFSNYYNKEEADAVILTKIREVIRSIDSLDLDLSEYAKKSEIANLVQEEVSNLDIHSGEDGEDGEDGKDGTDGITPHINPTNYHWMIGDEDTGVVAKGQNGANGTNGTNGTDGDDGIGIQNISYQQSYTSNAPNILTITLTSGKIYSYNIYNGKDGTNSDTPTPSNPSEIDIVESYNFGYGSFNSAWYEAQLHPDKMFQWILRDTDDDDREFTKVIWHIGNGKFIDTLGASILGHIDGVTIVCKYACVWRLPNNKNIILKAGINNFSFAELKDTYKIIDSVSNPSITSMSFGMSANSTANCTDSVISIDFGGLKLTTLNNFLKGQTELQYIDRLRVEISDNTNSIIALCEDCTNLRYAKVSGNISRTTFYSNARVQLFSNCPALKKLSIGELVVNSPNINLSFCVNYDLVEGLASYNSSLVELDISGFTGNIQTMNQFLNGQSKLRKLIIGNLNTGSLDSSVTSGLFGVQNCVLICTSSAPPTVPNAGTANTSWISSPRFSAIYVPNDALQAYKTAPGWSTYADMIYSIDTYIDNYNE